MLCSSCGKEIPDISRFCNLCGVPVQPPEPSSSRVLGPQIHVEEQEGGIERLLWWVGWRPHAAVILSAILAVLALLTTESLGLGVFLGLIPIALWIAGVIRVNSQWEGRVAEAKSAAEKQAERRLGIRSSDAMVYTLSSEGGERVPFVRAAAEYRFVPLFIGQSFVGTAGQTYYDLRKRELKPAIEAMKELYFRHISSVDYSAPYLRLTATSGESVQYESNPTEAELVVGAIRQRLRALPV